MTDTPPLPPLDPPGQHPVPPRRWIEGDLDTWERIEAALEALRARRPEGAEGLEAWLLDRSEFDSLLSAESNRRYVRWACHSEDEAAHAAWLEFQTEFLPRIKPVEDELDRRWLEHPARGALPRERWAVPEREAELAVRLFREENVPLEAEEEEIASEYGRICGSMTVEFEGRTRTLQELAPYQEEPDREKREAAWRAARRRRLEDAPRLEDIFDRLLPLRQRIARNAGFPDYREYKHTAWGRFDYRPEDCLALHEAIEREVLPLLRRMREARRRSLGLEALRPWDLAVDPEGRPPLRPFTRQKEQVAKAAALLEGVHPDFAAELRWMEAEGLLDLETRPGKLPGGFLTTFEDRRVPFIFANSPPTHGGLETLVHESGHAIHALHGRWQEPAGNRDAPLEFAEVASMGMECLVLDGLERIYTAGEARQARSAALEDIVSGLVSIAVLDAFQHEVYTRPEAGAATRRSVWLALQERFDSGVDWSGLEEERASAWLSVPHIFEVPFYYVEYAYAQMGALALWRAWRREPAEALARFRRGLALGGSRPLPALFEAAGLRFDARGEGLRELMAEVEEAWAEEALAGGRR